MTTKKPSLADEINARVDCEDLAYRLGLERPGDRGNFKSPHHADKSPSLSVRRAPDGRSRFKDWSCDVEGGPVDLYMHIEGCDFVVAVRALGEMYRISVETGGEKPQRRERTRIEWIADKCAATMQDTGKKALLMDYLTGRGIAASVVEDCIAKGTLGLNDWTNPNAKPGEVGHGGPAVATIVRAIEDNTVVGVDMRYLDKDLNGGVKTQTQGDDKAARPWCQDWRRFKGAQRVYVVESAINAMSISTALPGAVAVAVRGTGSVVGMDWRIFIGKQVILAFDNDKPMERGPKAGYCAGAVAAWAAHEALVGLDVPALMLDTDDWKDDAGEPLNDLNDLLDQWGAERLGAALKKIEPWLIPGMPGSEMDTSRGKPRVWLPFHDFQTYWRFRVKEDFTSWVSKFQDDEETGKKKVDLENVAGFRVAAISRVTIASPTSTMTGDKDTAPSTIFAVSVQVPRYGTQLLRRVVSDEQLHNVEMWKKLGPVFSPSSFLRMVNILERSANIGARDAVNFVGLAWRDGRPVVNEGPDCYFADPQQQCPYHNLVFPSGPADTARDVLAAFQATFTNNGAAKLLVWAVGAHLKAYLGFWPHFVMQAEKGVGKDTLVKRLERAIGMTVYSRQSMQTEFRILTSVCYTSHPVGWGELSANKQDLINKAVANLQEAYQYSHTRRGAELKDFLICAPVLLAGEDVPVRTLQGKVVRNVLHKGMRGALMPEGLPVFPVRQWLEYLAQRSKDEVQALHNRCVGEMAASCVAAHDDAGAERMVANYAAVRAAWVLLCDFCGIDLGTGAFMSDLTAEMNGHIKESVSERQPWVWIVEKLLSEISRGTFRFPYAFDQTEDEEPFLAVRTSHVMDHISTEPALREFWNELPVKSDRVFKGALKLAGVLCLEDVERTVNGKRVGHMVAMSLPALEQYGLYATQPVANPVN
jgi:hypothetical protein